MSSTSLSARVSSLVATPLAGGRRAGAARAPVAAVPAAHRVVRCAAGANPAKGQPVQAAFGAAATAKAVRHTTSTKAVATDADGAPRRLRITQSQCGTFEPPVTSGELLEFRAVLHAYVIYVTCRALAANCWLATPRPSLLKLALARRPTIRPFKWGEARRHEGLPTRR
jgi:hypothetical protein